MTGRENARPLIPGRPVRLTRSSQYKRVYGVGKKLSGRYMILFYAGRAGECGGVGITVSAKVGGAVVRNRAKRRIREALRAELSKGVTSVDMVFVATRRIVDAPFEALCQDVRSLIGRMTR